MQVIEQKEDALRICSCATFSLNEESWSIVDSLDKARL